MEDQGIIAFKSPIDNDYNVIVVYPENENYAQVKSVLGAIDESIAALVVGKTTIIVDGQSLESIDKDQFKAVQAHEICHGILEHSSELSDEEEIEADLAAIDLLIRLNEPQASEALSRRLSNQRGLEYSESTLRELLSGRSLELYTDYLLRLRK
jgi:hypothetical protein